MPALDGLRAVAILMVVVSHVVTSLVPGGFGVTLFFFISGFIITKLLMLPPELTGPTLRAFYIKRFFRLAPALFVFLFASGLLMMAVGHVIPTKDYAATLLYCANYHAYTMFPPVINPLVVTWSLAVEEHFYLLFPFVMMLFRKHLAPIMVGTLVGVLAWRCVLVFALHAPTVRTYCATDARIDSIAWGCLLSTLMHSDSRVLAWVGSRWAHRAAWVALAAGFLVRNDAFRDTLRYSLQGFAFFVAFYALFRESAAPSIATKLLDSAPMQLVGKISYSLYLYHFLALSVMTALLPAGGPMRVGCTLLMGFAAAYLSYELVEGPLRDFGARLASKRSAVLVSPELTR